MAKSAGAERLSKKRGSTSLWLLIGVVLIVTFFCYKDILHGDFTNWDDNGYVSENLELRQFNTQRIVDIFTQFRMGNFHPLVMLSYNVLFSLFQLNTLPYHLFNVILHVLNTFLVFYFIFLLSGRTLLSGLIASLLFGIHPLHVESVAWISATKDMLYTLFYLAGLICYVRYKELQRAGYYYATIGLFLLSCLAKAMAVTFPIVLLLIDILRAKSFRLSRKELVEKIPHLVLAILFGIIALFAQESINAMGEVTTKTFWQNIFIAAHGVWFYIFKMVLPIHLSAFYPYPIFEGYWLPLKFLISPFIVAFLVFLVYRSWQKGYWIVVFGALFYFVNIAQVLQLLPVGSAIAADRYFYISSVGLFYIFGFLADKLWSREKWIFCFVVILLGGTLIFLTTERTKVWQNSLNLWESVIDRYPNYPGAAVAYNNIGMIYRRMGDYELAFRYTQKALEIDPQYGLACKNLGGLYGKKGDMKNAEKFLEEAVRYSPKDPGVYNNLGIVYALTGRQDRAYEAFNKVLTLNPDNAEAYYNLGNLSLSKGLIADAIQYYERSIQINHEAIEPLVGLGRIYSDAGDQAKASQYYVVAARLGSSVAIDWLNSKNIPF